MKVAGYTSYYVLLVVSGWWLLHTTRAFALWWSARNRWGGLFQFCFLECNWGFSLCLLVVQGSFFLSFFVSSTSIGTELKESDLCFYSKKGCQRCRSLPLFLIVPIFLTYISGILFWNKHTNIFSTFFDILSSSTKLIFIQGNILYHFPSLQRTAAPPRSGRKEYVGRWADWVGGVEKFFKEKKWQFRWLPLLDLFVVFFIFF